MTTNNKKHHWLLAGQVVYTDGAGAWYERGLNALCKTDTKQVLLKDLGQVQQAMQARFFKETFPDGQIPTDIVVRDVFFMSVNYLGLMSEAEFAAGSELEKGIGRAAPN